MMTKTVKKKTGFKKGNDRLERMLAKPGMAERVEEIREASSKEDRIYAMNLATVRHAADLTQEDLADRLGVDQSVVSKTERRHDMLLSTFMDYLTAAGAQDARMIIVLNGREIELDLRNIQTH